MKTRIYTVSDAIAFYALRLPYPTGALLFHSASTAGGVLLTQGIHYLVENGSFVLGPAVTLAGGDTITVVSAA